MEHKPGLVAQTVEIRFFDGSRVIIRETVHTDDNVTAGQELLCQGRCNEPPPRCMAVGEGAGRPHASGFERLAITRSPIALIVRNLSNLISSSAIKTPKFSSRNDTSRKTLRESMLPLSTSESSSLAAPEAAILGASVFHTNSR